MFSASHGSVKWLSHLLIETISKIAVALISWCKKSSTANILQRSKVIIICLITSVIWWLETSMDELSIDLNILKNKKG